MGKRILILVMGLFSLGWHLSDALAHETPAQVLEATTFFTRILQETQNPLVANLVQESLTRLRHSDLQQVEIPLIPDSKSSLMVQMLLNQRVTGAFAVDTGATYSLITPETARQLAIEIAPGTPRVGIVTANGTIYAPVVRLQAVSIGSVTMHDVPVIVQDLGGSPNIAGLLGLNFFKNMEVTIKPDRLILGINQETLR